MAELAGTYEVFLSFRGEDTRRGFTDHLYNVLISAGVDTFRDDDELRVGEEIGPDLIKAITNSKISIPIFSKRYAESKWCLRELALIIERHQNWGQMIVPVFYDVDPWEVQHCEREKGSYNEFFLQYENNPSLDQSIVQQWKNALSIVGELKGLELKKETNGNEGSFVKKIMQKVLLELKKGKLNLPKNLVGIDHHMERLNGLLSSSNPNGVKMIGILVMSGLGKTTIAKTIYNQLYDSFPSHCFLHDVGAELQRIDGLLNLQNQLLNKILKRSNLIVHNVDEGSDKIKNAICNRKVFLVLDNVDDMSKIKELLVLNHSLYGGGSRIIITTTNEEVLLAIKVQCEQNGKLDVYEKYEPRLMGNEDALELFSRCAFMRDSPPDDYLDLTKEVISHAGGIPLVLETLGSLLSVEDDKVYWKEKLDKLRKVPPIEVTKRLKISYDALDFGQKQIYLDIACFFVGCDVRNPSLMWDACGFHASEGIRALERRSLIKIHFIKGSVLKREEDETVIWMHDQLRELGKQIINESFSSPLERSRLWAHCETLEALQKHSGQKNMEAIHLQFDEPKFFYERGAPSNALSQKIKVVKSYLKKNWEYTHPRVTGQELEMLPKLRFISTEFCDLVGDFKGLHTNLRWIRWRGCSGNSKPSNLSLKNIVILDLSFSRITHKWKWWDEIKMAEKLEILILSRNYYLVRVPHLSNLTSLKRLEIYRCQHLHRLDGLEQLRSLTYLNVSDCSLKLLPDLSKLSKLRALIMSLNVHLVEVQGLETLELLELLNVFRCSSLKRLPNMSNLHKLTSFNASRCFELIEVPGLNGLPSLECLHMIECSAMKKYPDVSNNKKLKFLVKCFSEVNEVEGLGELESLEHLEIRFTQCLHILPQLSKLTRLKRLEIYECNELIEIPSLQGLESLKYFCMSYCSTVRSTTFVHLKMLQSVRMFEFGELTEIHGLEDSDSLKMLTIESCKSIENLSDLSGLKNLWCIQLYECGKLAEIQGLEQLLSLTRLTIIRCGSLVENLPTNVTFNNHKWDAWLREEELELI